MLEAIPGRVFVVGVCLLITTIAYSSQFFVFAPALGGWSLATVKVLTPLNLLVLMVYYNYYLAVTTDPGRIPADWEPPSSLLITTKTNPSEGITGPRFCKSCNIHKPPRAHHCRYCRRCVLKMDHHCPWINNCVGYANYGHFMRFVFYVNFACFYVVVLLIWRVRSIMDAIRHFQFDAEPSTLEVAFMVVNFVLAFVVLFCVGILSMYHLYCMARNQSTIESWERSKVEKLIRRGKIPPVEYPFDISIYKNLCAVLGNNPMLWLWPRPMPGDGLSFPIRPCVDPRLPYFWPPRDPDDLRPSIFSSKYKRQYQARLRDDFEHDLQAEEHQLKELSVNVPDNAIDSEDYYDSGSFMTDSEEEYSLTDEEGSMQRLMMTDRRYGDQFDTPNRWSQWEGSSQDPAEAQSDDEDIVPLSNLIPRISNGISPKETKED